jgi:hypothetical protein
VSRQTLSLCLLVATACAPSFDLEPPAGRVAARVSVEPLGSPEGAPAVFRLRVEGGLRHGYFADFRLFEGKLSPYHLGRLGQHDLPGTLLEREVPAAVWGDGSDVIVAPVSALSATVVSLATAESGLLAEVTVDPSLSAVLPRRWPPPEERVGRGPMIFCGEEARRLDEEAVLLAPTAVPAVVRPGLGGDAAFEQDCVRVEPHDAAPVGALLLPPPLLGGAVALEPAPLVVGAPAAVETTCADGELPFGPSCASVEDDRVRLRAPVASFWALREPEGRAFVLGPGHGVVLRGLVPEQSTRLNATVFERDGASEDVMLEVRTLPARAHVVINEVLANPVGPERTSEWVELANDGRETVQLAGFELKDTTSTARLPALALEPGALVLVVGEGFAPDAELDRQPPARTPRLVVPALGSGGLANAGEPLRLVDREGRVVSRFPAVASKKAGQSVARVAPEAPDDEPGSFALHAAAGASPGEPNRVEP